MRLQPQFIRSFYERFFERFEVLREYAGPAWSPQAAKAWSDVFEEVLLPLMREGVRA